MILSTVEKFRLKTQYRLSTYSRDSNYKQKQGKESAREICLHLFLSSDVRGKFTYRIGTILDLQIGNVKNKQKKRTQESLLQKDNLVFKSEMLLRTFAGFLLSLGQTTALAQRFFSWDMNGQRGASSCQTCLFHNPQYIQQVLRTHGGFCRIAKSSSTICNWPSLVYFPKPG